MFHPKQSLLKLPGCLFAIALALSGMPPSALANPGEQLTPEATDPTLYKAGQTSFRKRCARCHGVNMANPGVGVFDLRTFPKNDRARFFESVTKGKNAMPSWGDVLRTGDLEALWVYVSSSERASSFSEHDPIDNPSTR